MVMEDFLKKHTKSKSVHKFHCKAFAVMLLCLKFAHN